MSIGRILAIDYGLARIGLAISNKPPLIASQLKTIHSKNLTDSLHQICEIVAEYEVEAIILGNPLHEDGQKSQMSGIIEHVKKQLEETLLSRRLDVHIIMWDETMTSYQAYENLLQKGFTHKKAQEQLDAEAARIMLQEYLDQ